MPDENAVVAEPSISDLRTMLKEPVTVPEVEVETPAPVVDVKQAKATEKPAPVPDPELTQEPEDTPGVKKRIGKALKAQREAEARTAELEVELELAKKPESRPAEVKPAPPVETKGKPLAKDFETYEAFNEALVDWKLEAKEQIRTKAESDRRAADAAAAIGTAWNERFEAAKANPAMPDFEERYSEASTMPISRAMHETIIESEHGPELAYHLATHPDEAARIAKLSPLAAARELGKIEAAITTPPAKPAAAKPLPKPAAIAGGSHAPSDVDLDKADVRTFKREFAKRLKAA
jgi:hypothetical protein